MKNIFKLLLKERGHFLGVLCTLVGVALMQVSTSYIQIWSFNRLVSKDFLGFIQFEFFAILVWWGYLFLERLKGVQVEMLITKISNSMRIRYVKSVSQKPYHEFATLNASDYAASLSNDVEMIENQGFSAFLSIIETVLLMSFSMVALLSFHYSIVILAIILTVIVTFLPRLFNKKAKKATEKLLKAKNGYLAKNLDVFEGYNILFSSNRLEILPRLISKNSDLFRKEKIAYARNYGLISILIGLISLTSQILFSIYTGFLVTQNVVSLGVLGSAGNIAAHIFNALIIFSNYTMSIKATSEIFNKFDVVDGGEYVAPADVKFESLILDDLSVKFSDKTVLSRVSLRIERGKNYAIVGESGSGKTTLFNAILGRIAEYEGTIYLNDKNLNTLPHTTIANTIAYAQQDKHLFNDTILNNVTLWKTVNQAQIDAVLTLTNMKHFDLNSNAKQSNLSEGEKQRLILARTLLLEKEVLFIDEGTSNLDRENALEIENRLLKLTEKTIVMITHHLDDSLKKDVDKVFHLQDMNCQE